MLKIFKWVTRIVGFIWSAFICLLIEYLFGWEGFLLTLLAELGMLFYTMSFGLDD